MGGIRTYNADFFPLGTRVRVDAFSPSEGTDNEWHSHEGAVIGHGKWTMVRMDKGRRHWPGRNVLICNHNLKHANQQSERS